MSHPAPETCLACGITAWDVAMTLVIVPEEERRRVSNLTATGSIEATELYAREPRCRDRDACADRVKAIEEAQGEPQEWAL